MKRIAVLALGLAAACSEAVPSAQPPLDQFYFPTGLAVRKLPSGQMALLVVSSNFDLRYNASTGGTLIAVDPDASADGQTDPTGRLTVLGKTQIGSFGGEVAVVDASTCAGWSSLALALVASRSQNTLYRMDFGDDGSLTCDGCGVPLTSTLGDPFGVAVACSSQNSSAFVSYLRTPNNEGWLTEYDLVRRTTVDHDVGAVLTYSGAYDQAANRLFVTSRYSTVGNTPLRWLDLAANEALNSVNLYDAVRGAETAGIALSNLSNLSNDPTHPPRAYVAVRIYDTDSTGTTVTSNVTAALAVLDLTPDSSGQPSLRILNLVPIDRGADRVRVLPLRTGKRDLVAVTCEDDHSVVLYDDEVGAVVRTFGVESTDTGVNYSVGKQPFGLAVERDMADPSRCSSGAPCDKIYVGAFDEHVVKVIEVDPDNPSAAKMVKQLGRIR